MKRGLLLLSVLTVALAGQAPARGQAPPPAAPAPAGGSQAAAALPAATAADPQVKLPPFTRLVLPNGLVVLLMEHHEVPLLSVQIGVRAGAVVDPTGREGLAQLTASLLRRGTKSKTADELAAALDFLGAQLGGTTGMEMSYVEAEFLVKDREPAMQLLAEVLTQPTFPEKEVTRQLARARDGIRQAKEEPGEVIGQYAARFFYGPGHPYGRPMGGDEESLKRITRRDLLAFHKTYYVPGNTIVALVGDLTEAQLQELITRTLGGWAASPVPPQPQLDAPATSQAGTVLLVDKPDSPQTHFLFVAPGHLRTDPDRTAVAVVNTLFGGRFTSWLNTKLRIEEGLTYGASSNFTARRRAGTFTIRSYTETPNTFKALDLALAQLDRLHRDGPSPEELTSVRTYLKGQYPTSVETADQLAGILVNLEFFGLGREEVDGYMERVNQVDLPRTRQIAAARFPTRPGLRLVLIGQAAQLRDQARNYGTLVEKSISAPGF